MMPMNEADIPLYTEFTSLKTNKLQTWVAVGGVCTSLTYLRTTIFPGSSTNSSCSGHSTMTTPLREPRTATWSLRLRTELPLSIP